MPNFIKYMCSACGFIYDPEVADPTREVIPITIFDDLPEEWTCPICGAEQFDFQEM